MLLGVIQSFNYYIPQDKERGSGVLANANHCILFISIKYLVHKLLGVVTRFFVSLIKVPTLLKISVLKKNIFPFVPNIANRLNYFSHGKDFMKVFLQ